LAEGLVVIVKKTYQQELEVFVPDLTLNWVPKQGLEAVLLVLTVKQVSQKELEVLVP
jgi:hypothetical protein